MPRDLLQAIDQRGVQFYRQPRTGMALHHWPRVIGGQLQNRLLIAQLLLPVIQLPGLLASLHPGPLPQRVVRVLQVQRGQAHRTALAVTLVKTHQFIDHDRHRPTIGDNVMLGQNQHMLVGVQVQQTDSQQRPLLQIERALHFLLHAGFKGLAAGHRLDRQGQGAWRMNDLYGMLALLAEGRAQGFMTGDQRAETVLQCRDVQRTAQAQGCGNNVRRVLRVKLPEEPLPLLRIGKPQRLRAVGLDEARRTVALPCAGCQREGRQITRFEQVA